MGTAVAVGAAAGPRPGGLGFTTDRDHLGQMAAAAQGETVPGSGPAITRPGSVRADVPLSPAELQRRKEAQQKKNLILGLVGAGALAIAALVGINMIGGAGNRPGGDQVAVGPGDDTGDPQPIARPDVPTTLPPAGGDTSSPPVTPVGSGNSGNTTPSQTGSTPGNRKSFPTTAICCGPRPRPASR
jgi:hypothetical protein